MIKLKSPSQIQAMEEAGRLSAKALRIVGETIEPGISTMELDACAERVIRSEGGIPAFKGYDGFPGSICCSINDMIVHGIPRDDYFVHEGDVVSIDTGAIVDGWVGDNAQTYACGEIPNDVKHLLEVTEQAMWNGISQAIVGNHLGDIGHAVERTAKDAKFKVIKYLVGHGVGRDMHEDPMVPNYGKAGDGLQLVEGLVIAIEPMFTMKSAKMVQCKDGWGIKAKDHRPSAHFERTIAITTDGPKILTKE